MMARTRSRLARNRNWRWLFLGQGISLIGDTVFDITIVLWVGTIIAKGQPWAPQAVGAVLIAAAAPVFLVGPIAGVFADRWDRRRIMMTTDIIRAVLIASLTLVALNAENMSTGAQLAAAYGVVALASTAAQFFNPSRFGVISMVVDEEDQARAFGLSQATVSAATVIGPPLAAPLLFSVGVEWALVVNTVSFLVSFVAVRMIRLPVRSDRKSNV